MFSEDRVEHTKRFDEAFLPRAPLAQFLESDKAVMVHIDFLCSSITNQAKRKKKN